jgi:hypothetical protein
MRRRVSDKWRKLAKENPDLFVRLLSEAPKMTEEAAREYLDDPNSLPQHLRVYVNDRLSLQEQKP